MEKIVFKNTAEGELRLWVYAPDDDENVGSRTGIVWIHGGGWVSGDPGYFGDDYDYFTERGAVSFGVEYRLVSREENDPKGARLHMAIEDCLDAIVYVKKHAGEYGINPRKIVVIGESAGGHLALCTATDIVNRMNPAAVPNIVVAYNPVTETIAGWSQSAAKIDGISLSVEEFYERYEILKAISPSNNIVKNNIPLLLLNGIDDKCVFPGAVMDFYERYISAGNKADIELYEATGHAFALPFWYENDRVSLNKSLKKVESFLSKYSCL